MSDPTTRQHLEWLGLLQPVGLVVSPPALIKAGVVPDRNIIDVQQRLQSLLLTSDDGADYVADLAAFVTEVLEWDEGDLSDNVGDDLQVALPEYGEVLQPKQVVRDPETELPVLLVWHAEPDTDLDAVPKSGGGHESGWIASPHARFERVLRETGVAIGLLWSGDKLRLIYAPRGESSGHLTFPIAEMAEVRGRPILSALHMLLSSEPLFGAGDNQRLPTLLTESRKYQSEVSTKLAGQVLGALMNLLAGFQSADETSKGKLLGHVAAEDPQHIYGGLLTALLRLVFLLYAEDQGLMPDDPVYAEHYSVSALYEQLREDAGLYPDTMDQRHGAWARLLSLFRLVHDGGYHGAAFHLPARHGELFDPDRFPFLEGRPYGTCRVITDKLVPPRVADGVVHRILEALLILDGERLSYRALDVEQVGSVYEAMMGFVVERAAGPSIGVRGSSKPGAVRADVVINLGALLAAPGKDRVKWLKTNAECTIGGASASGKELKAATDIHQLVAALGKKVSPQTPTIIPTGALYLQPTEERRRTGSHYTPRELTAPIVKTTLRPILEDLGSNPTPEQILALKVCDPAMGSGAFLVEACRQLADHLVTAWQVHSAPHSTAQSAVSPALSELPPSDPSLSFAGPKGRTASSPVWSPEGAQLGDASNPLQTTVEEASAPLETSVTRSPATDQLTTARRLVAQRCLYGVDKNPFAVSLAKLSLWLVTLAKDHPFTFLDHALKHGDSLVGLTRAQIAAFNWDSDVQTSLLDWYQGQLDTAQELRLSIAGLGDDDGEKKMRFDDAEALSYGVRLAGDVCIAAFFGADKAKARDGLRLELWEKVRGFREKNHHAAELRGIVDELRESGIEPFHWEVEFPEVFTRERAGFDAVVGNPPFMGGSKISSQFGRGYLDWVLALHDGAHGNGDVVAHFYRRAFTLLRKRGAFGLIATNTIAQGDTRTTGLQQIRLNGGVIYDATRRFKWPGLAAVIVSIVHIQKGEARRSRLDGRPAKRITAFLFDGGTDQPPMRLRANADQSFLGSKVYGQGFTFDDTKSGDQANPIALMHELIERDPRNAERIFPYIGGSEVNTSPTHAHHRYVISFAQMSEEEARRWPDLMAIVEEKVKPPRMAQKREIRSRYWWRFGETTPALYNAIAGLDRVLVNSQVSAHLSFAFLPTDMVYAHTLYVYPVSTPAAFAAVQSRPHEVWARAFASSMKDDLRYTASDCFETFPFPKDWTNRPDLEAVGEAYYTFRAKLMVDNNEGLTKTYNRFHDPDERDGGIVELRRLHGEMDRAVLDAYGWTEIPTACEFLLDYEIDEETWNPRKKKPYRYRWPDEVHDEVLGRLMELNRKRAEGEAG